MVGRQQLVGALRVPHHFLDGLFKFRNIFVLGIFREFLCVVIAFICFLSMFLGIFREVISTERLIT